MRPTTVASWAITSFPVPDKPFLVLTWPALFGRIHRVVPFETYPSCIYSRVSFRNSVERRPDVPFSHSMNHPLGSSLIAKGWSYTPIFRLRRQGSAPGSGKTGSLHSQTRNPKSPLTGPGSWRRRSECQSRFLHGQVAAGRGDNYMIEHVNPYKPARFHQSIGEIDIVFGW